MVNLEHLTIQNFRGFDSLEIEGFSKINLFVGKNNSGKTSILEAIFLLIGMSNPTLPNSINKIRGLGVNVSLGLAKQLKYLYHNLDTNSPPAFYSKFNDSSERWLELNVQYEQNVFDGTSIAIQEINGVELNFSTKSYQTQKKSNKSVIIYDNDNLKINQAKDYSEKMCVSFVPSDKNDTGILERLSKIITNKKEDAVLDALRNFDNRIEDFRLTNEGVFFSIKGIKERIPSNILGDGIRRFLNIITSVLEKRDAFICIDEIENGLHYSAYKLLWKSLLSFSEQNDVQLFITTHNIEMIESLKSVLEEKEFENMQDFAKVFKVAKTVKAGYQAYRYSFKEFQTAIDNDIEIRQ
jgi:AAA15 family ATPase/GTPase